MTHKYKINNNKVVGDLLEHVARNADLFSIRLCGKRIIIKQQSFDEVVIDYPHIKTTGNTPRYTMELILQNCSEIYPTVPLNVTRKELSTIEYLLAESDVPVCVPDVQSLFKKICKVKREFE